MNDNHNAELHLIIPGKVRIYSVGCLVVFFPIIFTISQWGRYYCSPFKGDKQSIRSSKEKENSFDSSGIVSFPQETDCNGCGFTSRVENTLLCFYKGRKDWNVQFTIAMLILSWQFTAFPAVNANDPAKGPGVREEGISKSELASNP